MIRLHITAEGQTEQSFAKKVLTPYLAGFKVYVDARCVLTSKDKRGAKVYDKVTAGVAVAEKIGIPMLREKCSHFNEWLSGLEQLFGAIHE